MHLAAEAGGMLFPLVPYIFCCFKFLERYHSCIYSSMTVVFVGPSIKTSKILMNFLLSFLKKCVVNITSYI